MTRRSFVLAGPVAMAAAADYRPRNLLAGGVSAERLAEVLLPRGKWTPFPQRSQRPEWEALPRPLLNDVIHAGEELLRARWPELPATLFLEFQRDGNRSHYESVRDQRRDQLRRLVIAECAEGSGRFLDDIGNGIWTTCEESFWGVPAHIGVQRAGTGLPDVAEPIVDLFAAETSALLAWTDYLLGPALDRVSPLIRKRVWLEADRRILTPCIARDDFSWMGLNHNRPVNNWNPWINSNWLASNLLLEPDPRRRTQATLKILRSLDRFLNFYGDDGGCDEGPSYWGRAGASLFDCLELLHSASAGALDFYSNPLVKEIGRYIYRTHIHDDWFTNFADASARLHVAADLVFRYGRRIGDEKMAAFGADAAQRTPSNPSRADSIGRQLPALFNSSALMSAPARQPLLRDVWMPSVQVMAARGAEGSPKRLYLAAQGGHNAESHNHNDVGNFIVFGDGEPAIIDVGVETYAAKTFSASRYDIWTMQSAYHNLPTIDGVMQAAGREFEATEVSYSANDASAEFRLNLAKAYPAVAGIESWRRTLRLDRAKNEIEIIDAYVLKQPPRTIAWTLMTAKDPTIEGGRIVLPNVRILFDSAVLKAAKQQIRIEDARLKGVWGTSVFRILLTATEPPKVSEIRVRVAI